MNSYKNVRFKPFENSISRSLTTYSKYKKKKELKKIVVGEFNNTDIE
jgi:hypothetical protein